MKIKFIALEREEGQTAAGKSWTAYKLVGTEADGGKVWGSPKIFDNKYNAAIIEKASNLEQGDLFEASMEKNAAGYWAITNVDVLDGSEAAKSVPSTPKKAQYTPKQSGGGKSDTMSKEDWAKKDKVTRESIARAVALKEANVNTKAGTKPADLIAMALEFEPYLLGTVVDDSKDGLEAPPL